MPPLSDILQVWGFENGKIIYSDGSMGFALRLSLIDASTWDDGRIDKLASSTDTFLNGLPPNLDLQFVQDITSESPSIVEMVRALGEKATDATARSLHEERCIRLKNELETGVVPEQRLFLFVRRSLPEGIFKKPRFFSKPKLFQKMAGEVLKRELEAIGHIETEITNSLQTLGVVSTKIREKEIAEMIYSQWNPLRTAKLETYDADDIRPSMLFTDVSINEKGFSIGGMHYRTVSLKLMPDCTYASMARALATLPFGSRLTLSIHVPDQAKELETLQTQRRIAFSLARGKKEGVSDIESEAKLEDLETLISELVAQGEKVFQVGLSVILKAENEEELRGQVSETIAVIRSLSGAEAMEESLASFDIFTESAIPNARGRERARRVKTSNLADFIPFFGAWTGFETPRIILRGRDSGLFKMDPFSSELPNFNQIVAGGSGSGKSFLTNLLLLQTLKENPKIFIVDIGGSYRKLCDNLSGQYIPFSLTEPFSLNPFDLASDETVPGPSKIKFLVGLIEMMTREDEMSHIGRLERAEIEDAVSEIYKTHNKPRLSNLRELFLHHSSENLRRFGKILSPWCGDSPYGQIVDGPTSVNLKSQVVCFDLKGLETHPDLQAVCLYLITDYVWREVQKDRSTMKFLVFDECWKLLENPAGSSFIAEVFRTFRKYFASAIAISQNIDDFAKSRVSQAILSNTSIKWILMQKGADEERLKEVLHLNETELALIGSLRQVRGEFSESFLMAGDSRAVVRITPTPFEYWLATTDPRDLSLIESEVKKGGTPMEILRGLSIRFPKGVVGSGEEKS